MLISRKIKGLQGTCTVPGDKSISHRALMLSSQTIGTTKITGLLVGEDVLHTADALRKMGVSITRKKTRNMDIWQVEGVGTGGLSEPQGVLDMGNSGTAARLMMGLVTPYHFASIFDGDASLRKRPMARVTKPLELIGAEIIAREGTHLPLTLKGTNEPLPIRYELPVASAQVKSAILMAALNIPGNTTVIEKEATRDHTERMLAYLGAEVIVEGNEITLKGEPELVAKDIDVPGDPSSAAFLVVAALIVPGSDVTIKNICINFLRTGLYTTLQEMGAEIEWVNKRNIAGEDVADLKVRHSKLKGVEVPPERAPSMIDEYPILSIAAAFAKGETTMRGLKELRVKESDRLSAIEDGLKACGIKCKSENDDLFVTGNSKVTGGGKVLTHMDHRIAMSFLVLGMASEKQVAVDDGSMIATSFPGFVELMNGLGGDISA